MYSFIHGILGDRQGGEVFKCFSARHLGYIFLTAAAVVIICLVLRGKEQNEKSRTAKTVINIAFGMYMADFFLMPLAYGEIDIEKLPFHACTAMCVMCFLSRRIPALEKFRTSFALMGLLSNMGYLIYPAGVMWHAVHPLTYRVIQTLLFHGVMTVYGFVTLIFDNGGFRRKNLLRDFCVVTLMTLWAMIGNAVYNGTDGEYSHYFNWFFVTADPFGVLDAKTAPFVMPFFNIALFFGAEAAIYGIYHLFKHRAPMNKEISMSTNGITAKDLSDYREIRGKIKKKTHLFGRYAFIIADGEKTAKVYVGKGIYEDLRFYDVGSELTVGYIGHTVMNIRPGIVYDEE